MPRRKALLLRMHREPRLLFLWRLQRIGGTSLQLLLLRHPLVVAYSDYLGTTYQSVCIVTKRLFSRDMLCSIALMLPLHLLGRLLQTCRYSNQIFSDEGFWRQRITQDFPVYKDQAPPDGWKTLYSHLWSCLLNPYVHSGSNAWICSRGTVLSLPSVIFLRLM